MSANAERPTRVDIGFSGGQVLVLRMRKDVHDALRDTLSADGEARWHEVETEDSIVALDLRQIVYVRLDTEQQKVGF